MRQGINHWLLSDTHFGHNRLVSLGHRPDDFENQLIDNLSIIGKNDILYHLGDVTLYAHEKWTQRLFDACPARTRILIMGNHDRQTVGWYYNHGWNCVCHQMDLMMYGWRIILSHVPMCEAEFMCYGVNTINVHGHVHNNNHRNAILTEQHYAVVMEHDYKPILLRTLIGM